MLEGFYKVRFQLNDAVGRSVMYVRDGKMLGGNSAFAHIGTYQQEADGAVAIEIKTVRHNPDPNYRAMAGTDDVWKVHAERQASVFASEDAKEGATAFVEKRAPVWKGK